MNRLANVPKFMAFGWLVSVLLSAPAQGQFAALTSVPEPTQLANAASASGSTILRSDVVGEVDSTDGRAVISVIEVEVPGGESIHGVRISLENSTSTDDIYLTSNLLQNFRDELGEIEYTSQLNPECRATHRCVQGIARCRPSQTARQAYCPARYSTSNSEEGLLLSTPRHSFQFPSVVPAQLNDLIDEAMRR